MKNKRGISPLIASVLLIGMAVALAAVVAKWGFNFIKQTAESTEQQTKESLSCVNELSFEISDVDCAQSTLAIDNRGDVDITKITLRIHKGGDIIPLQQEGVLALGKKIYHTDLAGAKKIEAIATIKGEQGKQDITCTQAIEEYDVQC